MEKSEIKNIKNSYIESQALWDDIYGNVQIRLENSYRIIFCLSVVIALAVIGLIVSACEPKIKPIPFILHGNNVITLNDQESASFGKIKPKLSVVLIEDFIRHSRIISSDNTVNSNNHIAALSIVTGAASKMMQDYFDAENKNTENQNIEKDITITNVLRVSNKTVEIRWIEEKRDKQGDVINSDHHIAEITYQFSSPSSNPIILKHNPFGFEITHLSWAKDISNLSASGVQQS